MCLSAYRSLTLSECKYSSFIAIPSVWYSLIDEEGEDYRLLIFEDQLRGYKELRSDIRNGIDIPTNAEIIIRKYFSYFCSCPSSRDVEMFVYNFKNNVEVPQMYLLKNRKKVEPLYVAEEIRANSLDPIKTAEELYDRYEIAKAFYEDKESYVKKVVEAVNADPEEEKYGFEVEEIPLELIPYELVPYHDINELYHEVVDEMFGGSYEGISSVNWTDKPIKQYYGQFRRKDNSILINCILNTQKVDREVIKYLIYHELLHRDYPKHDKAFRDLEHKYPKYTELDGFLDGEFNNYDINYR